MALAFVLVAAAVSIGGAGPSPGQASVELVSPTARIPRDSFKTWSLFLVCNPDWVAPEKSADLANLYSRFKSFGDAIGRDNLAVWFWKRQVPVNVCSSRDFCPSKRRPIRSSRQSASSAVF